MKRSLVVDVSVRLVYPSILVLSLYFLFAGHNRPGGGFVGGLAAAAAISLRYVAGGVAAVRRTFRLEPWTILGSGLLISVGTAIVPLLLGEDVLEHATAEFSLPLIGDVKVTSALPFDVGVYLIVVGLVLMIFEAFGDDLENELEMVEPPAAPATSLGDDFRPPSRRGAGRRGTSS
ncbi:MnhB domain-containing protein [Ilumatobacter sp.]|uniref:MnhB domain-containing protein n=1 Tax=Ilumatobacter sp. TaxID=1967498 RepID=UPI003B52971D